MAAYPLDGFLIRHPCEPMTTNFDFMVIEMIKTTSRKFTRALTNGSDQAESTRPVVINEWALDWPISHSHTLNSSHEYIASNVGSSRIDCQLAAPFRSPAERMVGLGFRCWMRGVQTGDTRFFDVCSRHYILSFGLKDGIILTSKLADWVYQLDNSRQRLISIHQMSDAGFSYDEVVAISMIAACQHSECPALRACVYAITHAAPGVSTQVAGEENAICITPTSQKANHAENELDLPSLAAKDFADGLADAGHILSQNSITYPLQAMTNETMRFAN